MNIVFYRYRNICEQDYIDGFAKLGLTVIEVYASELDDKELDEKMNKLSILIAHNKPMFVFSINYFPFISIVCQRVHAFYVSVSVTCPMVELFNVTIRNSFNRVFLFDKKQYETVAKENPEGVFYLPLGASVERLEKAVSGYNSYKYDISFVGSLYSEKDPFAGLSISPEQKNRYESIMKMQIQSSCNSQEYLESRITDEDVKSIKSAAKDFYPSDLSVHNIDSFVAINNYLSPHMTYIERVKLLNEIADRQQGKLHLFTQSDTSCLKNVACHGPVESLTEMPRVFRESKINLNITTRSMKTGIAQRVWDVLGCGGFLITNYQNEIPDYLEVGKDIVVYESSDELLESINYYLTQDDERKAIAKSGYEKVRKAHSTTNRIISMVTMLNRSIVDDEER
ncbi:glycosyltransferase family protein [Butyrivibrio sp. DSM 10294]|uniref:glycosyltransferase family protein n=1 Tax=Butyrivibrio sp. DSM 10294 TaxID=2972457 RepID=UPI00234EF24D|nr:glycosyltransferase [Butyrivibrio sp. DSM 10294]